MTGMASKYAISRWNDWLESPKRLSDHGYTSHVEKYGLCSCLEHFWLPKRGGYSDLCAIEHCYKCDATYYDAWEYLVPSRGIDDEGFEVDVYICPCCEKELGE